MEYPQEFPVQSRAKVEAAKILAGRKFDTARRRATRLSDVEKLFRDYVLTPFLAFAEEASSRRLWPVEEMEKKCLEFLRRLTIDAYYRKGKAAGHWDMISNWNGSLRYEFQQEIEKTSQWRKFENMLLKLAEPSFLAPMEGSGIPSSQENHLASATKSKARGPNPDIVKRRAIVKQNPVLAATGLCNLFDAGHIPLPKSAGEAGSWAKALRSPAYRHAIESLISRDRKSVK